MNDLKDKTKAELKVIAKELGLSIRGNPGEIMLIKLIKKARKGLPGKLSVANSVSRIGAWQDDGLRELGIDQSGSGLVGVPKGEDSPRPMNNYERLPESIVPGLVPPVAVVKPVIGGCSEQQVIDAVRNYTVRGMTIKFTDNCWEFRKNDKIDTGTMSQPVYNIIKCAEALCRESVNAGRMFLKS